MKCKANCGHGRRCLHEAVLNGVCLKHYGQKVRVLPRKYPRGCSHCKERKICHYIMLQDVTKCDKRKRNLRKSGELRWKEE